MNRADLRNDIEARMSDQDNAIMSDSEINLLINQKMQEIARYALWPFLRKRTTLVTVSGDDVVNLPTDCRVVTKVGITDANSLYTQPLYPVSDAWIQDNMLMTSNSRPYYYTDGGYKQTTASSNLTRTIRLSPKPDSVYNLTVTYQKKAGQLIADTDVPPFPEEFNEAIVKGVLIEYWRLVENEAAVADYIKDYRDTLIRLRSEFGRDYTERYYTITPGLY